MDKEDLEAGYEGGYVQQEDLEARYEGGPEFYREPEGEGALYMVTTNNKYSQLHGFVLLIFLSITLPSQTLL